MMQEFGPLSCPALSLCPQNHVIWYFNSTTKTINSPKLPSLASDGIGEPGAFLGGGGTAKEKPPWGIESWQSRRFDAQWRCCLLAWRGSGFRDTPPASHPDSSKYWDTRVQGQMSGHHRGQMSGHHGGQSRKREGVWILDDIIIPLNEPTLKPFYVQTSYK